MEEYLGGEYDSETKFSFMLFTEGIKFNNLKKIFFLKFDPQKFYS